MASHSKRTHTIHTDGAGDFHPNGRGGRLDLPPHQACTDGYKGGAEERLALLVHNGSAGCVAGANSSWANIRNTLSTTVEGTASPDQRLFRLPMRARQ